MNDKISLPSLVNLLSQKSGDTKKQSEDFIKEVFGLISEELVKGDPVKVKEIGTFKTVQVEARKSVNVSNGRENEIAAHRKVAFVPSKELAASVNEPFEMFETVELADDIDFTEEETSTDSIITESAEEPMNSEEPIRSLESSETFEFTGNGTIDKSVESVENEETEESIEPEAGSEAEPETEPEKEQESESESESVSDSVLDPQAEREEEEGMVYSLSEEDDDWTPHKNKRGIAGFLWGFVTGVAASCLIGALVIWGIKWYNAETPKATVQPTIAHQIAQPDSSKTAKAKPTEMPTKSESAVDSVAKPQSVKPEVKEEEVAPTQPSDQKKYDTISKTRYLTTMAKDHYGNYNLWPYIYIENQAFLGHPDRIKPGTKVVIPDLKKYGVNPNNPADIAKAKKKGVQIYSRYN